MPRGPEIFAGKEPRALFSQQNDGQDIFGRLKNLAGGGGWLDPNEIAITEHSTVSEIREIKPSDYVSILKWASNPEVRKHLDPLPRIPRKWSDHFDVSEAIAELADYYTNQGEPKKIRPIVAVSKSGDPVGVLMIRWRGDKETPVEEGIASVERFIVNPDLQGRGIGTTLFTAALENIFLYYGGYGYGRAKEVRVWVMNDRQAGNWQINYHFFRKFNFQDVPPKIDKDGKIIPPHWREYKRVRGIHPEDTRDAIWMRLDRDTYLEWREENPDIKALPVKLKEKKKETP